MESDSVSINHHADLPAVWLLRYHGTGDLWWNWINSGCQSVWSSAGCWHSHHQFM